jgi:2-dehydro-3-deoxyphosphogluconate aldolase / (4S)-4-hydroxy-2-oxoglutarate aldolase
LCREAVRRQNDTGYLVAFIDDYQVERKVEGHMANHACARRRSERTCDGMARVPSLGENARAYKHPENLMSKDRLSVLTAMMDQGVIPVFYHPDVEVCQKVIQACANGGAKCIEFTNRGDFAAHVFFEVTRHFAKADPSVIMGVGSIVDAPTAGIYIANGARFVVGPILNADVAKVCNRRCIPYSPGCGSASEISYAQELGCEIVKVFPGSSVGGPEFVKNVLGPMPWTRIMPTGGVEPTEESLRKWYGAGIVACGIGSNLITKELLAKADYAGIESRVRDTVKLIKTIRGK